MIKRESPWFFSLGGIYYKKQLPLGVKPVIVDEQFRKCVVYLCADVPSEEKPGTIVRRPIGTAFFVNIPISEENGVSMNYLVTASHLILRSSRYRTLFVRFNMNDGTTRDIPTSPDNDWTLHPDPHCDVALLRETNIPDNADVVTMPTNLFITSPGGSMQASVGDELFSVSLFTPYPGESRNEPICVFGHISLMPQLVPTELLGPNSVPTEVEVYLTEWKSWGGMSGSPVFIFFAPDRNPGSISIGGPTIFLLGLVHGHMPIKQEVEFVGDIPGGGKVSLNTGIALVVPSQRIEEMLNIVS